MVDAPRITSPSVEPGIAPQPERSAADDPALNPQIDSPILEIDRLTLWYGAKQALREISLRIPRGKITAFIGPSGCGKSTLLRCFNRMNDLIDDVRIEGEIRFEGRDIYRPERRRQRRCASAIGMVFQKSNPFPKSIYENVAYGCRIHGLNRKACSTRSSSRACAAPRSGTRSRTASTSSALGMSGGQQQRLCIARAIAVEPEVILLDEPCSALDPIATAKIEELMQELKKDYTLVIVTHNMQQASRVSDYTAFMYLGELIEYGEHRQDLHQARARSRPRTTSPAASAEAARRHAPIGASSSAASISPTLASLTRGRPWARPRSTSSRSSRRQSSKSTLRTPFSASRRSTAAAASRAPARSPRDPRASPPRSRRRPACCCRSGRSGRASPSR